MDISVGSGTYRVSEALAQRLRAVPPERAEAVRRFIEGAVPAPPTPKAPPAPKVAPVPKVVPKKKKKVKCLNPRLKAKKAPKPPKDPRGREARFHRSVGGGPLLIPDSVRFRRSLIIKRK